MVRAANRRCQPFQAGRRQRPRVADSKDWALANPGDNAASRPLVEPGKDNRSEQPVQVSNGFKHRFGFVGLCRREVDRREKN
jgi:hypothetical protein